VVDEHVDEHLEGALYPEDLKYTAEHEWVRRDGDAGSGGTVRVGITDFAQDALGDIVYVTLPEVGATVQAGQACGEVESTKSVSDVYAPVSGTVTARNEALDASPDLLNSDPYGEGWMFDLRPDDPAELDGLLDSGDYRSQVESA
jgi:glycine cleavage system H protein